MKCRVTNYFKRGSGFETLPYQEVRSQKECFTEFTLKTTAIWRSLQTQRNKQDPPNATYSHQTLFTSLYDAFPPYIDPQSTSMLHHERKAPIPSPGQPNRSTRLLYRPNIVAGCVVVRCGRRKPVCVTILQHRTLKHTVFGKSSPRFVAHPGRISPLVRWNALHNWRWLPETGSPVDETSKYSTQLHTLLAVRRRPTTAPYVPSVQEANGANIRGSGNFGSASYGRPCKQHGTATNESKTRIANFITSRAGKITTVAYTRVATRTLQQNIL